MCTTNDYLPTFIIETSMSIETCKIDPHSQHFLLTREMKRRMGWKRRRGWKKRRRGVAECPILVRETRNSFTVNIATRDMSTPNYGAVFELFILSYGRRNLVMYNSLSVQGCQIYLSFFFSSH